MYRIVLLSIALAVIILGQNSHVTAQTNSVATATWSPNGQFIARIFEDGLLEVVEATTNNSLFTHNYAASSVYQLDWSPDGQMLAVGLDENLVLWDNFENFPQQNPQLRFTSNIHSGFIISVAWSGDSTQLFSMTFEGELISWNLFNGTPIFTSVVAQSRSLSWGCDGNNLFTVAGVTMAKIFTNDGSLQGAFEDVIDVSAYVACSPDGSKIAVGSGFGEVTIYDITHPTLNRLQEYIVNAGITVNSLSWSYTGEYLLASSGSLITVLDTVNEAEVYQFDTGSGVVSVVDWSPHNNTFVYGGENSAGQVIQPNLTIDLPVTFTPPPPTAEPVPVGPSP